jgi:hypothetical protein
MKVFTVAPSALAISKVEEASVSVTPTELTP